jgi:uncharacterized protein (TIGR03435 family)
MKRLGILLAAAAGVALGQALPEPPQFEAASLKPADPHGSRRSQGGPGTRDPRFFRFQQATLNDLIADAYHVEYFQISSKIPLDRDRFDVSANVPEGATKQDFRLMMRHLLEERFHLRAHTESRDFAAYELIVAKSGLRMQESGSASAAPAADARRPANDGFPELPPGKPGMISNHTTSGGFLLVRIRARQEPVSVMIEMLQTPGDQPVVDKTGLKGKYDFTLEYTHDLPGTPHDGETPVAPSLFTALQQQLGLQLVAKKLPFDVVVVESFDRAPVEN